MESLQLALKLTCAILLIKVLANSVATRCGSEVRLLIALPFHDGQSPSTSWERGREILPGAEIAIENINRPSECNLLQLTEVVYGGQCGSAADNFNFIEKFFTHLTLSMNNETLVSVGILCSGDVFQLITHPPLVDVRNKLVLDTVVSFPNPIKPSRTLIRALDQFMKSLKWNNLGIITETGSTYFSRTAEELYKHARNASNINIVMYHQLQETSQMFPRISSKLIFLSAGLQTTVDMLCQAHQKDKVWPRYVWILHSFLLDDIRNLKCIYTPCSVNELCSINESLENVLFIKKHVLSKQTLYQINTSSHTVVNSNPYAIILHNLILETAFKIDKNNTVRTNVSWPSKDGKFEVTQIRNGNEILIATISEDYTVTFFDNKIVEMKISDKLQPQYEGATVAYTIIFTIEIVVGFTFVSVMLIIYTCLRSEPEVKSTGYVLSLFIFLGCYTNLIFLSILLYFGQPIYSSKEVLNFICSVLPWISGLGISSSLIAATVLVKLVRVYRIFNRFTVRPLGKKSSDICLAAYVLLIQSPVILILVIWAVADPFRIQFPPSRQVGFKKKQCTSDYLVLWLSLLVLYMLILFFILTLVAIKSRKIRERNFKDTKKVNVLIFCLLFDVLLSLSLWWLLDNLGTSVATYISSIPLHIGHFGIILLSQLVLIAPKISAPLLRSIKEEMIEGKEYKN